MDGKSHPRSDLLVDPLGTFPRRLDDEIVQTALRTASGQAMATFARYLFAEIISRDSGFLVILHDIRFSRGGTAGFAVVNIPLDQSVYEGNGLP